MAPTNKSILFFILPVLFLITGCDFDVNLQMNSGVRSGNIDDDYVEEPVSGGVEKYEASLTTSNNIVELFKSGNLDEIHDKYFDELLKKQLNKEQFQSFYTSIENKMGVIIEYKPMQWGFYPRVENDTELLYSVKIVKHSETMMKHVYIFKDDGDYQKIIGFLQVKREGVALPGQI